MRDGVGPHVERARVVTTTCRAWIVLVATAKRCECRAPLLAQEQGGFTEPETPLTWWEIFEDGDDRAEQGRGAGSVASCTSIGEYGVESVEQHARFRSGFADAGSGVSAAQCRTRFDVAAPGIAKDDPQSAAKNRTKPSQLAHADAPCSSHQRHRSRIGHVGSATSSTSTPSDTDATNPPS